MKVNMVCVGALGVIPLSIAQHQGIFKKHGVDVHLEPVPGDKVPQLTIENPFGYIGAPAALMRASEGTELKILASFENGRISNYLVARPNIKRAEDLRGKRVGVRVIGAALWIQAVLALEQLGLDPQRDSINILPIGDPPQIAEALEAGKIDAAILSRAQSHYFAERGYSIVLDLFPANIYSAHDALVVTTTFLEAHPDVAKKIVSAMIEGVAFSLCTREQSTVLQTIMTQLKVSNMAAANESLTQLSLTLVRNPSPSVERLRDMQRIMSRHSPRILDMQVEKLVDSRIVQQLEKSGFIDLVYRDYGMV